MKKNILLGITASIASYKAYDLIGLLKKKGCSVRCVMSRDAKWFVSPLVLETLTGKRVIADMFAPQERYEPIHISLAGEADLVLIMPATADVIGKIASGICDDILTCTVCSTTAPIIFAPAMNDKMFKNAIVQENIKYLRGKGYHFVDPIVGHLACGREGIGHLAPLERILKEVGKYLGEGDRKRSHKQHNPI